MPGIRLHWGSMRSGDPEQASTASLGLSPYGDPSRLAGMDPPSVPEAVARADRRRPSGAPPGGPLWTNLGRHVWDIQDHPAPLDEQTEAQGRQPVLAVENRDTVSQ